MKPPVVLVVDDEEELRRSTAQVLDLAGFQVQDFPAAERALDFVTQGFNGAVVTDIRMPSMDGMSLMRRVRDIDADIPVILVTGHGDVQLAVRAMREGAYDFIEKPFDTQHLADMVARALRCSSSRSASRARRCHSTQPASVARPSSSNAAVTLVRACACAELVSNSTLTVQPASSMGSDRARYSVRLPAFATVSN